MTNNIININVCNNVWCVYYCVMNNDINVCINNIEMKVIVCNELSND